MTFKIGRVVSSGSLFVSTVLLGVRYLFPRIWNPAKPFLLSLACICAVGWLITTLVWCRCPHCKCLITRRVLLVSTCPVCGEPLLEHKQANQA